MLKDKLTKPILVAAGVIVGLGAGIVGVVSAQSTASTSLPVTSTTSTQSTTAKPMGHAPLGGDGIVSSINGTQIVMAEEADEGGASYTVDASSATFTNNGAAGTLADIKVGDKIFVHGTVNGTNVVATNVSLGHGGMHGHRGNDNDADDAATTGTTTQ